MGIRVARFRGKADCKMQIANCKLQIFGLLAISLPCAAARADVIELVSGGRLDGKIAQSDDADKTTCVIDLAGGGHLTIPRSQIAHIDPTSAAEAEYEKLALTTPDTA